MNTKAIKVEMYNIFIVEKDLYIKKNMLSFIPEKKGKKWQENKHICLCFNKI